MPTLCQLCCPDCWQKKQVLLLNQPNPREWGRVDQTSAASPFHVLQNHQAQQLGGRRREGRASSEAWREEATTGHGGRKQAAEGRAGPCGGTAALLSSGLVGPATAMMRAVENPEVERESTKRVTFSSSR